MFKLLRELTRTDAFGFPAAFDDDRNAGFSVFSEPKSSATITRRVTIRDVSDQWRRKTQVRSHRRRLGLDVVRYDTIRKLHSKTGTHLPANFSA